jgi:hypothetical protein
MPGRSRSSFLPPNPRHFSGIPWVLINTLAWLLFFGFEITLIFIHLDTPVLSLCFPPKRHPIPSLGLFFLTSNITTRTRVTGMMETWGNHIRHHPAVTAFIFASIEDPAYSYLPSVKVFPHYSKLYSRLRFTSWRNIGVQLIIKDVFTMEYCVRNTTADWCFRLMDDLYVNEAAFDDFVEWIASHPNPRSTPYIIGNCVTHPSTGFYLQGGSGYCFSRAAAERLVETYEEFIPGINIPEDMYLTKFIKMLGLDSQACDCPYFSGHFIGYGLWKQWNWTKKFVGDCPPTLQKEQRMKTNK